MKIIFSNYDDIKNPYYGGGGAIAIHEIAKRLAVSHDITVVTGSYPGSTTEVIDGVKYQRVGIAKGGGKVGQLAFQLFLPFLVRQNTYDIWMESFTPPFSTDCLQFFTQKPVVGIVHMLSGNDMNRKYRLPFTWIEDKGLATYRYLITTTKRMKSELLAKHIKADIEVIPNGVSTFSSPARNGGSYILYLGRIEINQKGLDYLLKAFAKIESKITYKLYIAGSGEMAEVNKLRSLVKALKMKQVRMLGKVDESQKHALLQQAVCVVVPSRFETFSMTALEAMAHGCPVICFAINGLSWIPADSSIKSEPFNVDALADSIFRLATQPEIRQKMGTQASKYAALYSWNTIAGQYERFLRGVIGS